MLKKKKDPPPKKDTSKKSAKELKKELEEKSYGQKQSKSLKMQLKKLDLMEKVRRKEIVEREKAKEESELRIAKKESKKTPVVEKSESAADVPSSFVCRYLVDALHNRSYHKDWVCPENCGDVHVIDENQNIEECLEAQRALVSEEKVVSFEAYEKFVEKLMAEERVHERKKEWLKSGYEMFRANPKMFVDVEDDE